jgi:hypothetical protein
MFFRSADSQKAHNSAVTCKNCQGEITFVKPSPLPSIIGAHCQNCGRHNIYAPTDVHVISQAGLKQSETD